MDPSVLILIFGILFILLKSKKFYNWLYSNCKFTSKYPIRRNSTKKTREALKPLEKFLPHPLEEVSVWMRSCRQEILQPIEGTVYGVIPAWLKGNLYRNGPGSWYVEDSQFHHLFDCSALLHRFSIETGRVTYQNTFVDTETRRRNLKAKTIVVPEFGTSALPDPNHSILDRFRSLWKTKEITDNSLISIYPIGYYLYTFAETPYVHRINPTTLATEERICISDYIGIIHQCSHPHVMTDGSVYNVGIGLTCFGLAYKIIHFPAANGKEIPCTYSFKNARVVATVPCRWKLHPCYMHSFAITENYFVLIEQPLTISLTNYLKGKITNNRLSASLKWFNLQPVHFYVIDRKTGRLKKTLYANTFFYFHIINQYELFDNHLVMDICCYNNAEMISVFDYRTLAEMQNNPQYYVKVLRSRILRFILPLSDEEPENVKGVEQNSANINSNIMTALLKEGDDELADKVEMDETQFNRSMDRQYQSLSEDVNTGPYYDTIDYCGNSANLINLPFSFAEAYRIKDGRIFLRPELLCSAPCEMPAINYQICSGIAYQYFFAVSMEIGAEGQLSKLVKVDILNHASFEWSEPYCYLSEPIFVPSPNCQHEDDGIILSTMLWSSVKNLRKIGLLILCAKTWTEIGRCVFQTPEPMPKCLHGWFTPNIQ